MKKLMLLFALLALAAPSQAADKWKVLNTVAKAATSVSIGFEIGGAWGKTEADPLLGSGRFGYRQASVQFGLTALPWAVEAVALRHKSATEKHTLYKKLAIINGGVAAFHTWAAVHNFKVPSR